MNLILMLIWLFVLWCIFWSLGSVLLIRLDPWVNAKTLKGIFFWFSECPHCKHRLHAKNLVPIVSYFVQKGQCEYCGTSIGTLYPTLEILSGLLFVFTYLGLGGIEVWIWNLMFWLVINRLFLLMIIYDIRKYELHLPLRAITICISLFSQFFFDFGNYGRAFYRSLMLGWVCLAIYYGAKRYVRKRYHKDSEWFGQWDIMMGFLLGTLMSFVLVHNNLSFTWTTSVELLSLFFILSSGIGLVGFGIKALIEKQHIFKIPELKELNFSMWYVPFIPCMILAFWLLLLWWQDFIRLVFVW